MKRKSNGPLNTPEQEIIDYYQSQQLSSDRLYAILDDTRASSRNRVLVFAFAASLFMMSAAAMIHQNILASQRTDMVLREAALNHSSKLQMDSDAESLTELQDELGELPFEIKMPASALPGKLAMVGGRYCTISGKLAAHIKFSDPETEQQYSLFLAPSEGNLKSINGPAVDVSGVDVKLWQENDVVYVLAANNGVSL